MTSEQFAHLTDAERKVWELCQKATPGPWDWVPTAYIFTGDAEMPDDEFSGAAMLADGQVIFGVTEDTFEPYQRDSAFIAHARTALPEALRSLAEARQAIQQAQKCMKNYGILVEDAGDAAKPEHLHSQVVYLCNRNRDNHHNFVECADKLAELRAAVAEAPCDTLCNSMTSPARYGLQAYQKHLNGQTDAAYACDCWKSRLPK